MDSDAPRKEVRKEVREIMAVTPDRRFTLGMIASRINSMHQVPVPEELVERHLNWNHAKGFVDFEHNHELEREEWFLTDKGKRMEQVG